MKLLIISDTEHYLSIFDKVNDAYSYGNINIDHLFYLSNNDAESIKVKLTKNRYHLVLVFLKGVFVGNFVSNEEIVNSVNNYLAVFLRKDELKFDSNDIQKSPISLVNKTTSYFNVFLEIPKAISLTTIDKTIDLDLQRLDVISEKNYYMAYYLQKSNCNYYILNYKNHLQTEFLEDLLKKIE